VLHLGVGDNPAKWENTDAEKRLIDLSRPVCFTSKQDMYPEMRK